MSPILAIVLPFAFVCSLGLVFNAFESYSLRRYRLRAAAQIDERTPDPLAAEIDCLVECYDCQGGGLGCARRCFLANTRFQRLHGFCLSCGRRTSPPDVCYCWDKGRAR